MASQRYARLHEHHTTVEAMLADPDLHGDLLLIGLYLAAARARPSGLGELSARTASHALFGRPDTIYTVQAFGETTAWDHSGWRWQEAMRDDIRRYDYRHDPDAGPANRCHAPRQRGAGTCGRRSTMAGLEHDPATGRLVNLTGCSRHVDWYLAESRRRRAEWAAVEPQPQPPANAGGLLRRHLPTIGWEIYWRQIDPQWVPPPEAAPPAPPPPLTLVINNDLPEHPQSGTARPALSLVST